MRLQHVAKVGRGRKARNAHNGSAWTLRGGDGFTAALPQFFGERALLAGALGLDRGGCEARVHTRRHGELALYGDEVALAAQPQQHVERACAALQRNSVHTGRKIALLTHGHKIVFAVNVHTNVSTAGETELGHAGVTVTPARKQPRRQTDRPSMHRRGPVNTDSARPWQDARR